MHDWMVPLAHILQPSSLVVHDEVEGLVPDPLEVTASVLAPSHHCTATAPGDVARANTAATTQRHPTGGHDMRHPFITAQLLRQARTAASIETSNRPAPSAVPGRRIPRKPAGAARERLAPLPGPGPPFPTLSSTDDGRSAAAPRKGA
jgi:hypothetical protein